MDNLKKHEQFEMEILSLLSKHQFLNKLVFGGGTCLRLCFSLDRYSVDLDFWSKPSFTKKDFNSLRKILETTYELTDFKEKHFTFLLEIRSANYPQRLKLEIRKKTPKAEAELNIAFSPYSVKQVRLETFTLNQMWQNKVAALIDRSEIRDAYDLEFLIKKIALPSVTPAQKVEIIKILNSFTSHDYKVKLGSLLNAPERKYYSTHGFKVLRNSL